MESWFRKVGDSIKAGAEDLSRGVQGKETGRAQSLTFDSPYIQAKHMTNAGPFTVQLRFPGFANQTLRFERAESP